jgi:hypothetical protein
MGPMDTGKLALALALLLVSITALSLVLRPSLEVGTIEGRVIIGPWSPVEPPGGNKPPPEVYISRRVILESSNLPSVEISMNGMGYFRAEVRTGTYSARVSNCTWIGCSDAYHETVVIRADETTTIQIDIDTCIR